MAMNSEYAGLLIREAFLQLCDEEYRDHEEAEPIPVSFAFELYMDELALRRHRWSFRRNAKPVIVLLLTVAIMLFSVIVAALGLWESPEEPDHTFSDFREDWTEIGKGLQPAVFPAQQIGHWYFFPQLPPGYEQETTVIEDQMVMRQWKQIRNEEIYRIGYSQSCETQFREEYEEYRRVEVNGREAILYRINSRDRINWLVAWCDDYYWMQMWVSASKEEAVTAEQLIAWAESLQCAAMVQDPEPDSSEMEE